MPNGQLYAHGYFIKDYIWVQTSYPSMDEWMMKMWYINSGQCLATANNPVIYSQMDKTGRQYVKEKQVRCRKTKSIFHHVYMEDDNAYLIVVQNTILFITD